MLSSLANYLLGGSPSAHDVRGDDGHGVPLPVETRLNQVEVEGDDWILIDRAVEATTALEESWYVTPPACFTRAGPIHVETSPLEDLLIEHPSMSVYRAAAPGPGTTPDTPPPTPDTPAEFDPTITNPHHRADAHVDGDADAYGAPSSPRQRHNNRGQRAQDNINHHHHHHPPPSTTTTTTTTTTTRNHQPPQHQQQRQQQQQRRNNNTAGIHEHRPARDEEARCVQLRTAQKVLEKRAAQALKRGRLERGNKVREVASGKGKRPRRQDRLRLQNSGANNNRKC